MELGPIRVYDDSMSDDTAPSSDDNELIKFETSNAIYFCFSFSFTTIIYAYIELNLFRFHKFAKFWKWNGDKSIITNKIKHRR